MNKRIAVIQSSFAPWKGYFDLINYADILVVYDSVQFTKNDWRNRNLIKTKSGTTWFTIPVKHKFGQSILETEISGTNWIQKQKNLLFENYSRTRYFKEVMQLLDSFYSEDYRFLSEANRKLLTILMNYLEIDTEIVLSSELTIESKDKTERIVEICKKLKGTHYLSGPSAKSYIEDSKFLDSNIELTYMNYNYSLTYQQPFPPFNHQVSILDLLFCVGKQSKFHLKSHYNLTPESSSVWPV